MKSSAVLVIHSILFFSLAAISLASPFLMLYSPDIFTGKTFVIGFSAVALLVLGSWPIYGGACPFTVWENNFRKREGEKPYKEACINHYAQRWLSVKLPKHAHTWIPIALLILPIAVGITHW